MGAAESTDRFCGGCSEDGVFGGYSACVKKPKDAPSFHEGAQSEFGRISDSVLPNLLNTDTGSCCTSGTDDGESAILGADMPRPPQHHLLLAT
ncbi:MAG: hypothetical protein ACPIOQ_38925 [Promethearchaeia archaeon]|jgi:hypothetical protein